MLVVEKLATSRRFHEITLDKVAKTAKVGKGTLYHYFKDKDELFFQVATSGFEELCELLKRTIPFDTSFTEELLKACKQITKFFTIIGLVASFASPLREPFPRRRWVGSVVNVMFSFSSNALGSLGLLILAFLKAFQFQLLMVSESLNL